MKLYGHELGTDNDSPIALSEATVLTDDDELPEVAERMRTALNTLWARPTLGWWTSEQAWRARSTIDRQSD